MNERDKKIIMEIKVGKEWAFKQLYEYYADYALRTAYGITKNKADASDIVQETFIKVYRHIDSFHLNKPFKPWFYRILINEARTFLAKKSRQPIVVEDEGILDILKEDEDSDADEQVYSALEQLSDSDRMIIMLKYITGFKEREIAELLDLNINTVKSRLHQARKRLKLVLGGEVDEAR